MSTDSTLQSDRGLPGERIALSLVSHTNVGKTTLARTLLGRDIGEVRDEAHVTMEAERHTMIESPQGDRLELWDTPGFGDSLRLAKRFQQAGHALGWLLTEVWDRYRDRAFYASQRAVRHVLDEAELVLYLVNASEAPEDARYVDAELLVLAHLGKPVLVLLNQLGPPRAPHEEAAELARWRAVVMRTLPHDPERPGRTTVPSPVHDVLPLDAFARCWVQEGRLLERLGDLLPPARRPAWDRLRAAWAERQRTTFHAAIDVLASRLVRAATDRAEVPDEGWTRRLREFGAALGLRREGGTTPREVAMATLAERLDGDVRTTTDALIRLHGLDGRATAVVLERLAEHYASREPLPEGKAAVVGGVLSGALAGLKADVISGGLTMGGGLLVGGVLGALGGLGVTRGLNLVRGVERPSVAWAEPVLDELVRSALLGYLAVAHYGRGRGAWAEAEHPAWWSQAVDETVEARRGAWAALWAGRDAAAEARSRRESQAVEAYTARIAARLEEDARTLLLRLYPGALLSAPR